MRIYLLILLLITISYLPGSFEIDMFYHGYPGAYDTLVPNCALACYFKPGDFGVSGYDYKIKIIGFIGYNADGSADIYVTSKEDGGKPICNPDNHWQGADYGPKSWHINNSYPNYDDCNIYNDDWHYKKDITKFWCIYHLKTSPPPYPTYCSYPPSQTINSLTWIPGWNFWSYGVDGNPANWCMHCVIVYWGTGVDNTSLGVVKTLFK